MIHSHRPAYKLSVSGTGCGTKHDRKGPYQFPAQFLHCEMRLVLWLILWRIHEELWRSKDFLGTLPGT